MKYLHVTSALAASVAFAMASPVHADTGYNTSQVKADHRPRSFTAHIWYPANEDGSKLRLGANAFFKGIDVSLAAPPKLGEYPVILLSHGSGGNAVGIGWFAEHLAESGMIVIAPNHPGSTSGDSSPAKTVRFWERPADLSAIADQLDTLLPEGLSADAKKIGAVGFSLGGYSVLALAGVRASKQQLIDYCDRNAGQPECRWLASGKVDLAAIDRMSFERDNSDTRIKAIVAIDPGLAVALTSESLETIGAPVQIVNLGLPSEIPAFINGKGVAETIPGAAYDTVEGASHFSFLGECTVHGKKILGKERRFPVCAETGGRERADIHEELKRSITAFLEEQLPL